MAGVRILIVEDNILTANNLKDKLEGIGYSVCGIASSGAQAVQIVDDVSPDLLLMDIELNGDMGVIKATKQIRSFASIPIIYVTAYTDTGSLQRSKVNAPYGYITKPFEETSLLSTIESALHKQSLEKELKKAEEQYRAIVENSPTGIAILDDAYRLVFVNDKVCQIFGFEHDELTGSDFRKLLDGESKELVQERYLARQRGEPIPSSYEAYILRKDQQRRCIEIYATVTRDSDGRARTIAQILDITDRQQSEAALRESESRYRRLIETSPDAIFLTNLQGTLIFCNQKTASIHGYEHVDEIIGKNVFDLISPEERQRAIENEFADPLVEKVVRGARYTMLKSDGGSFLGELSVSTIHDDSGKPGAFIGVTRDVTERVFAEEQLQLQAAALETTANAIMVTDTQGIIQWVNQAFCKLTGYDREEVLGQNTRILKSDHHDQPFYEQLWKTITAGEVWHGVLTNQRKNGTQYTEEMTITPVTNAAGETSHYVAIKMDISERIQADMALRESEERYRQVVELSPMLIAIQKPHKITYINRAGASMLGIADPKQAVGQSLLEYVQREERQELYERFFKLARSGQPLPLIEQTIIRPDGTRVELEVSATVTEEDGDTTVQVIAWDITERKLIQEALRRQAALADIELAINQPHELQTVLDQVAKITTQLLPASGGASVALWDEISHDFWISSSTVPEPMKNLVDRQIRKPDGASRWILNNKSPVITPDVSDDQFGPNPTLTKYNFKAYIGVPLIVEEEVLGVLFVLDLHTRQYTNDDLDFLTALANRAALAIAKVRLYSSLQQARSSAEETARAKDQFLANMSHELRTPLTAVVSSSELLQDTQLDRRQKELVHTTSASADKLLALINDILDFSKLEAEKVSLETRPFDLRACIEDALDLVTMEARRKGLDLAYTVADGVPNHILGDANRLGQVLTNLLNNSVKFTQSGEVVLNVRVRPPTVALLNAPQSSKDVIELLFSVQDTGIGIDPDKLDSLFTPFKQLDASTTRKYGGTGLGLAISKQLVQLMGGDIWAESSGVAGEGATFFFTLWAKSTTAPLAPYLQTNPPKLQGKRILVVTHSENQRQIVADLMKFWGMRVFAFDADEQAISWLQPNQLIDLVVLGVRSPEDDHSTFIEEFYRGKEPSSIPLMLLTSEELAQGIEWPVEISGYLNPPIKPEPLYNLLIDIFSQPGERFDLSEEILTTGAQTAVEHPLNILIAEDDPTNQKVIAMILAHLGYQPDITNNGLEVIAALEEKPYDVILMDLQMPEMDGLSTTRYIRAALPLDQQPYIIALTADARQEAREAMFSEGVNEYLTKPVHGEMLSHALEYASKNQQRRDLHIRLPEETMTQAPPAESPIDESVLSDFISLMGDDSKTALEELFDSFINNTPGLVQEMKAAAVNEDWQRVRWNAHTLKGNSELFGGIRLAHKCRELEKSIDSGIFDDIPDYVAHIEVEFAQIQAHIIAKRSEL
jgi:PAS domain S-box-containing protein